MCIEFYSEEMRDIIQGKPGPSRPSQERGRSRDRDRASSRAPSKSRDRTPRQKCLEGELGCLGSLETGEAGEEDGVGASGTLSMDQLLTDPDQAADFIDQTGCDALAIAIGTSHGAYKFSRPPTGDILAIDRIKAIHERIPDTHLVMHGSSSVPQDWLQVINESGGEIPETYGVPVEEIQEGIKHGVRKVNIDTDLRLASTGAIRRFLRDNTSEFDPRKYLQVATDAMKEIVIARYEAFGTAGNASLIKPIPLDAMALRYQGA